MGIGMGLNRGSPYYERGGWERVPQWHPLYWIGVWPWRWRRWNWDSGAFSGYHDGEWEYQTDWQRAQETLREKCDDGS